jgi:hypothetical protein
MKKLKPTTENIIKLFLIILMLICLFRLPYGYYQLIRYIALVGFAILAYNEYERKNVPMAIVYIGLVLLFQPIVKVPLGRQVWNIVDVVVAVGLGVSVFVQKQMKK